MYKNHKISYNFYEKKMENWQKLTFLALSFLSCILSFKRTLSGSEKDIASSTILSYIKLMAICFNSAIIAFLTCEEMDG